MSLRCRFAFCAALAGLLALGIGSAFEGGVAAPSFGSGESSPEFDAPVEMEVTVQRTLGKTRLVHERVDHHIGLRDLADRFRALDDGSPALASALRCDFPDVSEGRRSLYGSVRYLANYLEDYEINRLSGLGAPLLAELVGIVCVEEALPVPSARTFAV